MKAILMEDSKELTNKYDIKIIKVGTSQFGQNYQNTQYQINTSNNYKPASNYQQGQILKYQKSKAECQ